MDGELWREHFIIASDTHTLVRAANGILLHRPRERERVCGHRRLVGRYVIFTVRSYFNAIMIACRCRTITSKKRNNQTQYCVRSKYFHYFSVPFFVHFILLLAFLHSSGWPFESTELRRMNDVCSDTDVGIPLLQA